MRCSTLSALRIGAFSRENVYHAWRSPMSLLKRSKQRHGVLQQSSSCSKRRGVQAAAFSAPPLEPHADGSTRYTLILYVKEECPLCEGLQQKLEAVVERAQFLPSVLSHARVEIRDIGGSSAWEAAYRMSVPVLVRAEVDGSGEVELPRPAPRLGADGLQRHLEKALAPWEEVE